MDNSDKTIRLEKITGIVHQWSESGQSMRRFCKEQKLSYYSFIEWRKKIQGTSLQGNRTGGFIPVTVKPPPVQTLPEKIEIHYPGGIAVKLPLTTKAGYIRTLIQNR